MTSQFTPTDPKIIEQLLYPGIIVERDLFTGTINNSAIYSEAMSRIWCAHPKGGKQVIYDVATYCENLKQLVTAEQYFQFVLELESH